MTTARKIMRSTTHDDPYWYDEGGNYVAVQPSSDGGVHFIVTDYGNEYAPRLGVEEVEDLAAYLAELCQTIRRERGDKSGLYPQDFARIKAWHRQRAGGAA